MMAQAYRLTSTIQKLDLSTQPSANSSTYYASSLSSRRHGSLAWTGNNSLLQAAPIKASSFGANRFLSERRVVGIEARVASEDLDLELRLRKAQLEVGLQATDETGTAQKSRPDADVSQVSEQCHAPDEGESQFRFLNDPTSLQQRFVSVENLGWGIFEPLRRIMQHTEEKFSPRVRGLFLLNVLTFLYGSNITVVKDAESVLDPFCFCAGRFVIAAIAFSPFLKEAWSNKRLRYAGMELGLWAGLGYLSQAVGLLSTDAGRASFIGTFTVIEVPIIAGLFGAKIRPMTWFAAAAAIAGVGLLESSAADSSFLGDSWTIVSALVFGVHMLRSEHHAHNVVSSQEALPLIALQLSVTALVSCAFVMVAHFFGLPASGLEHITSGDWAAIANWPWLPMAYTGVLSTALCLWIEVVALRDVPATEAAVVYTVEPLWGAAFAWLLLGERWGPAGWAGASLILGGSLAMQFGGSTDDNASKNPPVHALPDTSAIDSTSLARSAYLPQPHCHDTLVSGLAVAAAVALVLAAAATTDSDTIDAALMASASCQVVAGLNVGPTVGPNWAASLVEGSAEMEESKAASLLLGGQEIASLASLMKAYALACMDREESAASRLKPVQQEL